MAGSLILFESDGVAGEVLAPGALQGAQLGRGRGDDGEGGGAGEVLAQGFADKLGAAAVFTLAGAFDLAGDRHGDGHGDEGGILWVEWHRL